MRGFSFFLSLAVAPMLLSACGRDLGSDVYTADSTLSLTLEGQVLAARQVTIKNNDKLSDNAIGGTAGAALGGVAGANVGSGGGSAAAAVGGAVAGAVLGAAAEGALSTGKGYEYVVKVDASNLKDDYYEGSGAMRSAISSATTNGLVTIVQGDAPEQALKAGDGVYVIFSDKRSRVIKKQF